MRAPARHVKRVRRGRPADFERREILGVRALPRDAKAIGAGGEVFEANAAFLADLCTRRQLVAGGEPRRLGQAQAPEGDLALELALVGADPERELQAAGAGARDVGFGEHLRVGRRETARRLVDGHGLAGIDGRGAAERRRGRGARLVRACLRVGGSGGRGVEGRRGRNDGSHAENQEYGEESAHSTGNGGRRRRFSPPREQERGTGAPGTGRGTGTGLGSLREPKRKRRREAPRFTAPARSSCPPGTCHRMWVET